MITEFLDFLGGAVFDLIGGIIGILPLAPDLTSQIQSIASVQIVGQVISWVNWFLPLDLAAAMIATWATGMMVYLGVKMALKFTGGTVR